MLLVRESESARWCNRLWELCCWNVEGGGIGDGFLVFQDVKFIVSACVESKEVSRLCRGTFVCFVEESCATIFPDEKPGESVFLHLVRRHASLSLDHSFYVSLKIYV